MTVPTGRITALVGPSGSGKTTILDLLTGINHPDAGRVLLDGADMREVNAPAWRRMIGYVPQDSFLFHDTLANNLTLNDPSISREAIEQALVAAGADFVVSLPRGLDTIVGERGGRLSGGQRQRIALARALARQPRLLILDEATSSLDAESEEKIKQQLRLLKGRMTVVLATHRPALVEIADVVYRLKGGTLELEKHPVEVAG